MSAFKPENYYDWTKFKKYWEEIGKPQLEYWHVYTWQISVSEKLLWNKQIYYRIKDDMHHELRLKWVNSNYTLPIEFCYNYYNMWGLLTETNETDNVNWWQEEKNREYIIETPTNIETLSESYEDFKKRINTDYIKRAKLLAKELVTKLDKEEHYLDTLEEFVEVSNIVNGIFVDNMFK